MRRGWCHYRRLIARRDYRGDQATLDVVVASIDHIVAAAGASGVNGAFPRLLRDLFGRAVADGHGGEEIAAAIDVFRRPG